MWNGRESKLPEEEQRWELALLRLRRAQEQISYIPGIMELGDYKTAANRSYYSVFYAMRAVLALDGFDSKSIPGLFPSFVNVILKPGFFRKDCLILSANCFPCAPEVIMMIFMLSIKRRHVCNMRMRLFS